MMLRCCTNAARGKRAACSSGLRCRHRSPSAMEHIRVKEVKRPAPVLVAALYYGFDGLADAAVGLDSRIPQIVEAAENVVVPKRREREAEPAFVDDFAGSKRAEHASLEQILLGPLTGLRDGRRFAPCPFVVEQSFEHANGGMERRAPAFGCFEVPAAIFQACRRIGLL